MDKKYPVLYKGGSPSVILDPSVMDVDKAYLFRVDDCSMVAVKRVDGRLDVYYVPLPE